MKGVHSIKIQARESDNAIEIEEIKSVHSVKVQPRERLNALDIEEVKGIRSVKIRARGDASANSNFNIAWGTDFYRRLFRIKMKLPQIEDNKAKKVINITFLSKINSLSLGINFPSSEKRASCCLVNRGRSVGWNNDFERFRHDDCRICLCSLLQIN